MLYKHRCLKIDAELGRGARYGFNRYLERAVRKYVIAPTPKARRELFIGCYDARLNAYRLIYRKYEFDAGKIKKIVDRTFYEMLEKYRPVDERSLFLGFLRKLYLFYCLTNLRKEVKRDFDIAVRQSLKGKYLKNSSIPVKEFFELIGKAELSNRQKNIALDYYVRFFSYERLAKKYAASESTIRNTNRAVILKLKKIAPSFGERFQLKKRPILETYCRKKLLSNIPNTIYVNERTYKVIQQNRLIGL